MKVNKGSKSDLYALKRLILNTAKGIANIKKNNIINFGTTEYKMT